MPPTSTSEPGPSDRPFNLSTTLVLALVAFVVGGVCFLLAAVGVAAWAQAEQPGATADDLERFHREHLGAVLALSTVARSALLAMMAFAVARMRSGVIRPARYLALKWPTWDARAAAWGAVAALVGLVGGIVDARLPGTPLRDVVGSGGGLAFAAVMVAGAPLGEELFFRGVVFTGVRHSQFCGAGAGIISAAWSAIAWWALGAGTLAGMFGVGVLAGLVRQRTGSVAWSVGVRAVHAAALVTTSLL